MFGYVTRQLEMNVAKSMTIKREDGVKEPTPRDITDECWWDAWLS